ncbi:putative MFS transporter, AGZA family, xanthine/uracil permease [Thermomonospora echinospora]|uniref:Putative MFS transporter, AGZA family, xanthine/uracil permease n=1 Tax=Thermomonospora echinospora TaxID=1992 RepID=A0A1H6BEH4_9ACTN|nr:NCS2 family permease [Thermomonospora echinospora]SEG58646.1 putative MFS transporter, AGZA family, xanthine/uracil permease [Thermomonospora echinospora]
MTETKTEPAATRSPLDRFFDLSGRGTTVGREVRGGITTFFAMAYIILLNPIILGGAKDITGATLSIPQLTTMTALSAAIATIIMGLVGNAPLALAAGLGINAVVAYQAAPQMTWAQAMGLVVLEGIVIVLLALTGVRERIMNSIPLALKHAIAVGIGTFIALIGLVDAGFVTSDQPSPPLTLGTGGTLATWPVLVFAVGLLLMIVLYTRRVPGAILIGIVVATVLAVAIEANARIPDGGWGVVTPKMPEDLLAAPDFGLLFQVDLFGGFGRAGFITALVVLFTLVLSGFFDAMGTILGISDEAGLVDEKGRVPRLGRILAVDGLSASLGGLTSSSANTVYVESAAGVGEGARTGLANLVTGALFVGTLFLTPLAAVVPAQAAAPALVLVGALMMTQVAKVDWRDLDLAIPAFLTIVMMPFTYSITNGIGAGLVVYTLIKAGRGKWREVYYPLWIAAAVFAVYFALHPIRELLGVG